MAPGAADVALQCKPGAAEPRLALLTRASVQDQHIHHTDNRWGPASYGDQTPKHMLSQTQANGTDLL